MIIFDFNMVCLYNGSRGRELIRDVYDTVFTSLKPDDFAVMGIFQKYRDQLADNVSIFEEWTSDQK